MARKKTPIEVLDSWETIYDGIRHYVLTPEAREIIEAAYVCQETDEDFIYLEIATERDGEGTGKFDLVEIEDLCINLANYLSRH